MSIEPCGIAKGSGGGSEGGLGKSTSAFRVYIKNRPDYAPFDDCASVIPVEKGTLHEIGLRCGNGWRKVFNVYAKLLYALDYRSLKDFHASWQDYRDTALLQKDSDTALLFSEPSRDDSGTSVRIVMGKHYALALDLPEDVRWLDNEFAIGLQSRLIVCPYFDYRQLSNIKIIRLVELIGQLENTNQAG